MKKAKIILAATLLIAAVGGALAFKAMRTGQPTYYTTTSLIVAGKTYTASIPVCIPAPALFITTIGTPNLLTYYTTNVTPPLTITTFRATDGSTISFEVPQNNPSLGITACTLGNTRVTNID